MAGRRQNDVILKIPGEKQQKCPDDDPGISFYR